jgi:effector-binding domain-containing protein
MTITAHRVEQAIAAARPVDYWAATLHFTGSIKNAAEYVKRFQAEFDAQGLGQALENAKFTGTSIIVLAVDPRLGDGELWVGLTVPAKFAVKAPLEVHDLHFDDAVSYLHVGPYEEIGRVHDSVRARAAASTASAGGEHWPVVLLPLNDPQRVQPQAIQTEVIIPLHKGVKGGPVKGGATTASVADAHAQRVELAVRSAAPMSANLVTQSFKGTGQDIDRFLKEFMAHVAEQRLGEHLSEPQPVPWAILHGDPQKGAVPIDLAFPIAANTQVKEPLKAQRFTLPSAAKYLHVGDYREIAAVHRTLAARATAAKAGAASGGDEAGYPVVLRLVTDPKKAKSPAEIETEVIVPLTTGAKYAASA